MDHVNVFLYDGAIVPDPAGIMTGGHENKSARTLSIRQGEHIGGRTLPGRRRPLARALRPGSRTDVPTPVWGRDGLDTGEMWNGPTPAARDRMRL
jgi:hypothetical protein